jgi:phospholipid transport system substrate-binding protein
VAERGGRTARTLGAVLAILLGGAPWGGVAAAESAAVRVVESLHDALVENMREGERRGFRERVSRLEPVVDRSFDFQAIVEVALGRVYPKLDATTQARFRALMRQMSVLTYALRFSRREHDERFVVRSQEDVRGARVLVRTRLERDDGDPIALDYVLHSVDGTLRIVNVLAEGVSDLSLKRAQYAAVIRREGVEQLLRKIEEQVEKLLEEGDTSG